MAHYGQLIDNEAKDFFNIKEKFRALLVKFFNNPIMLKLKTFNDHDMYVSEIRCLLSVQKRYVIAYAKEDGFSKGTLKRLEHINWENFQTRTLDESQLPKNLPLIQHVPNQLPGLDNVISKISSSETETVYSTNKFPLTITMLHPKKMSYNYQDKGTIASALETYQTILTWN